MCCASTSRCYPYLGFIQKRAGCETVVTTYKGGTRLRIVDPPSTMRDNLEL